MEMDKPLIHDKGNPKKCHWSSRFNPPAPNPKLPMLCI